MMKEIAFSEIDGVSIGHCEDNEAKSGVSVLYFKNGAQVGCDISGGGPASREIHLTDTLTADNPINAIVFSGGSAFGLEASCGVVECLEEKGIGYDTGFAKVPLVCQSCIYDLGYGKSDVRPDKLMGYNACRNALEKTSDDMGNVGAGIGASVGKLMGMRQATKAGLGTYAVSLGDLKFGAVVVVNAFGDIFDPLSGQKIAGLTDGDRKVFLDFNEIFMNLFLRPKDMFTDNTTIGCVVTNGKFDKAKLNKIAKMSQNAYARCINPVGTMADGDSIYAASVGDVPCDVNLAGVLGAYVLEKAIINGVNAAKISDEEYLSFCR